MSSQSTTTPQGHIVGVAPSGWGHIKCLIAYVGKALHSKPVYATIFVPIHIYEKASKEADLQFEPGTEDALRKLVRVVGIDSETTIIGSDLLSKNFIENYKKLLNSEPIPQTPEGEVMYEEVFPPQIIVLDFFLTETLNMIRSISGNTIPIYALQSAAAIAYIFLFGPKELGGLGNLEEEIKKIETTDDNLRRLEIKKLVRRRKGELLKLPGFPPLYDYEMMPQVPIIDVSTYGSELLAKIYNVLESCDGIIMNSLPLLEKPAFDVLSDCFPGKPYFNVGPVDFPVIERIGNSHTKSTDAHKFLDTALEKYGSHSVIYISFGTNFFFKDPSLFWTILDVLVEQNTPFMFCVASPYATIPDDVQSRINNSGVGYFSKWMPQVDILHHQALGWFMTHCGQNSVTEALSAGVPMMCCPFDADQPVNAINLTFVHNVAYELYELRSGDGLRPIHRLGDYTPEGTQESIRREFIEVLTKARGEDGSIKRQNARKLQGLIKENWAPGGYGWTEIERSLAATSLRN